MRRLFYVLLIMIFFTATSALAEEITPIGDIQRGMSVTVKGEVTRITDEDEFRLEDGTGKVSVDIGDHNRMMVKTGETVIVRGFMEDEPFEREVYAQEIERENGEIIELK